MAEVRKGPEPGFKKPVYILFQVNDEDGNPADFDSSRLNIMAATRDAGVALDIKDDHPHVIHKKVDAVT